MAKTALFLNDFSVNTLTQFCTNDFNFHARLPVRKIRNRGNQCFHFGPKTPKTEKSEETTKLSKFWFFGDFRCGALLFMVIHVIYKYKNK